MIRVDAPSPRRDQAFTLLIGFGEELLGAVRMDSLSDFTLI